MAGFLDFLNDGQGGGILGSLLSGMQPQAMPSYAPGQSPWDPQFAFGQQGMPQQPQRYPTMPVSNGQFNAMDAAASPPGMFAARGTQASMPPQAQPPQMPLQQPQQPQAPTSGITDHLMAGLRSMGQAPTLGGALFGLAGGLISGHDPETDRQQKITVALAQAGIPPERIAAMMASPEIMKAMMPTLFPAPTTNERDFQDAKKDGFKGSFTEFLDRNQKDFKPQFTTVGHDSIGNPTYGWVNPNDQSIKPYAASNQGQTDVVMPGDINSVPASLRGTVQQMIDGRMAPPTGAALRSKQIVELMKYATMVDPSFDANTWAQRNTSVRDFSSGKSSEMVRAANQTIHHVGALIDSMDRLHNSNFPLLNSVGNTFNTATGKGAVTEFLPNAHAVAEELSKVFKGANLSDAEVRQWEKSLHENMSPEQQRAAVGKIMTLLQGSLSALEEKRLAGMGQVLADKGGPLLKKESQDTIAKVNRWLAGEAAAAGKPLGSMIGNGETITGWKVERAQ